MTENDIERIAGRKLPLSDRIRDVFWKIDASAWEHLEGYTQSIDIDARDVLLLLEEVALLSRENTELRAELNSK